MAELNHSFLSLSYRMKKNNSNTDLKSEFMRCFPEAHLVPGAERHGQIQIGNLIFVIVMCSRKHIDARQWVKNAHGLFAYDVNNRCLRFAIYEELEVGSRTRFDSNMNPQYQVRGPEMEECILVDDNLIKTIASL